MSHTDILSAHQSATDAFCFIDKNLYLGSYESICILQNAAAVLSEVRPENDHSQFSEDIPDSSVTAASGDLSKCAVLTIDTHRLPIEITGLCRAYKFVKLEDSPVSDFVSHFDEIAHFIDENRQNGATVLVHCNAGISRSVTAVAAYIMKTRIVGVEDALRIIRETRPGAAPNENFLEQLRLYESMGNRVEPGNRLYRQWKLRMASQTGVPNEKIESFLADSPSAGENTTDCFCCRMCRCPLFLLNNLVAHEVPSGSDRLSAGQGSDSVCALGELFIEPVVWMKDEIMQTHGKLNCPKCKKKVGTFSWIGEKCACGLFVTPTFHMDKGKVEPRRRVMLSQTAPRQFPS